MGDGSTLEKGLIEDLKEQVNTILGAEAVLYEINYKVEGIEQSGNSLKSFCPIHQESLIRSLMVDPSKRHFRCNYSGCAGHKGGTLLELYCLAKKCSEEEGIAFWAAKLGLTSEEAIEEELAEREDKGGIPQFTVDTEEKEKEQVEEPAPESAADIEDLIEDVPVEDDIEPEPVKEDAASGDEKEPVKTEQLEKPGTEEDIKAPAVAEETGSGEDDPKDTDPYAAGVKAFEINKYSAAMGLFRQALEQADEDDRKTECEIMLARCLVPLKKNEEAIRLLENALKRPEVQEMHRKEILYRIAEAWEKADDYSSAGRVLKELLDKYGKYRDADTKLNRLQSRTSTGKKERSSSRISFI